MPELDIFTIVESTAEKRMKQGANSEWRIANGSHGFQALLAICCSPLAICNLARLIP
jgi:hypothetical protein